MEIELLVILFIAGVIALGVVALVAVFKVVAKIYPYAYLNARIRAMHSRLLKKDDFTDLLDKPYNEIIYTLDKKYFPHLASFIGSDFSYSSVDSALRASLIKDLAKIYRMVPANSKKFVSIILSKYDLLVIQSIVRSSHAKLLGPNSIKDIVSVTEVFHKNFLDQGNFSLTSLYNELKGTAYHPIMEKHLEELKKGHFLDFELELDLLYFRRILHEAKSRPAKQFVKRLIDMHNVSLVLKELDPIIPGGKIPLVELEPYTKSAALPQLVGLLKKHGYEIAAYENKNQLEHSLYKDFTRFGQGLLSGEPLSENSLMGFIVILQATSRNVNILLKLKSHNFTKEQISEVLSI